MTPPSFSQQYGKHLKIGFLTQCVALFQKIGPWGPQLIWQLATKYKMSRHHRHLQYVMYTMTNEGGVCTFSMYVSQKVQNVIFFKNS